MKLLSDKKGITINISTEAVVRAIVISLVAFFVLKFLGKVDHEIRLILGAVFLAIALNPPVSWLANKFKSRSRILATGIAYLIVMALLIGFLALVLPPFARQSFNFLRDVPQTLSDVRSQNNSLGKFVHRYNLDNQVDKVSSEISNNVGDVPGTLVGIIGKVGGTLISVITVMVLTFMMLVEGPLWIERAWAVSNKSKLAHRQELASKMYKVVTGYVNGQVLIAMVASFFALITLLIASTVTHTSINAVALAGIVFLFGLIPLIGNTLAAVIVVIICLFSSWPLALIMAIYFPVYQQIENATLTPHIQSKGTQLTPLLVFIAALVGAGFAGLLGAFVAIPAAGCVKVLVEDKYGHLMPSRATVDKR